jgi:hypothetical protein
MKKIFALSAASVFAAAPAMAGVYGNVESNTGFAGGSYDSSLLETHVGYEGDFDSDNASWYVQGGPAFGFVADEENTQLLSGKVGASYDITEDLTGYGEVSALSSDDWDISDLSLGVKAGLTYRF